MSDQLSHVDATGRANMVDVGHKSATERRATARGFIRMKPATLAMISAGEIAKGDVFAVARIAGIQAAKKTSDWIPLCHPLLLTHIAVDLVAEPEHARVRIEATVALTGNTGVEMEALAAVSATALTLFDMCKAVDKTMVIGPTYLLAKTGGKAGPWRREDEPA